MENHCSIPMDITTIDLIAAWLFGKRQYPMDILFGPLEPMVYGLLLNIHAAIE